MKWINSAVLVIFKTLAAALSLIAAFLLIQVALYLYEGGMTVADEATDPPLSHVFQVRNNPVGLPSDDKSLTGPDGLNFIEKWLYWSAMRKFPTLQHCISKNDGSIKPFNALDWQTNWKSFRAGAQAQICIHHIVTALEGKPDDVVAWLRQEGFKANWQRWSLTGVAPMEYLVSAYWISQAGHRKHPFSSWSVWGFADLNPLIRSGVDLQIWLSERSRHPTDSRLNFYVL